MNTEEAIKKLAIELRRKSLIPFCGAGISRPSGLPSGKTFMQINGFDKLSFSSAMSIAQVYPHFVKQFNQTFGRNENKPNILHNLLTQLNTKYYITTNYDQLLEKSYRNSYRTNTEKELLVIKRESDIPKVNHADNILIKYHGDVEVRDLLVLSKEHYIERLKSPNMVDGLVRFLFATHTILFIGYSLQDDNIFHILEQERHLNCGDLPDKYIILPERDEEFERYLDYLNVIPIYLSCDSSDNDEITACLSDFLFNLWCQYDFFEPLTNITEIKNKHTLDGAIQKALLKKNENDPEEAAKILIEIIENTDWENNIHVIPSVLWLYISVHDKMEQWNTLEIIQDTKLAKLLSQLEKKLPPPIYTTIRGVHESSLALVKLRSLDLKKAEESFAIANTIKVGETTPNSMKILQANTLTVGAIIRYTHFIQTGEKEKLEDAQQFLKEAEKLLSMVSSRYRYHHDGRFWGTKAYVGMHRETEEKDILAWAERAHGGDFRTENGQIAGRYCHAYCYYHRSQYQSDPDRQTDYLKRALELLLINDEKINEKQFMVKYKNSYLIKRIHDLLGTPPLFSEEQMEAMYRRFQPEYRKKIEWMTIENWLKVPIN